MAFLIAFFLCFQKYQSKGYLFFYYIFLAPGGGLPLCPEIFTVCKVTLPVLRVFHCERYRIQTRDHCFSSLEHYQLATTSPKRIFVRLLILKLNQSQNMKNKFLGGFFFKNQKRAFSGAQNSSF